MAAPAYEYEAVEPIVPDGLVVFAAGDLARRPRGAVRPPLESVRFRDVPEGSQEPAVPRGRRGRPQAERRVIRWPAVGGSSSTSARSTPRVGGVGEALTEACEVVLQGAKRRVPRVPPRVGVRGRPPPVGLPARASSPA